MEVYEGNRLRDRWYSVKLVDSVNLNTPVLGVVFGGVTVGYGFEGAAAEVAMAVLVGDWREQGGGNYWLQMGLVEFANFGRYMVRVSPTVPNAFAIRTFIVEVKNQMPMITTGIAQGGAAPSTIQLSLIEPGTDHIYNQDLITIVNGLGAGQTRIIMEYIGATQTVRVNRAWEIVPNNTSEYIIIPNGDVPIALQGIAQAGAPGNIQLALNASAVNEYYTGSIVYITSGVGAGQARIITSYTGGTQVATVYPNWATNPNGTSVYEILAVGPSMVEGIDPALQAALLPLIAGAVFDVDARLHPGAGVGFRNLGNILGQLGQSEFEQRTNVFAAAPVAAQGIDAFMVAKGCIQYQRVDMSYIKNWVAPDRTYYLLYHYNAQRMNDVVRASLGIIW
jgi:hypothetical protein